MLLVGPPVVAAHLVMQLAAFTQRITLAQTESRVLLLGQAWRHSVLSTISIHSCQCELC